MATRMQDKSGRTGSTRHEVSPYALVSGVCLAIAILLLWVMVWQGPPSLALGFGRFFFYVSLVLPGLAAAWLLFGVLKFYTHYKGEQLGGWSERGGRVALFLLLMILGFCLPGCRQLHTATQPETAVLKGVVLLNMLEGPPVVDAEVSSPESSLRTTDNTGCFELPFPHARPGQDVLLTVRKEGHVVVHEIMLTCTLQVRGAPPVRILLCKPDDREAMAVAFFRLKGCEALKRTYREKTAELLKQDQLPAERDAVLQQELEKANAALEKMAEQLARETFSAGSGMYEKATRLFLDEKLDEALAVLDEAQLERRREESKRLSQEVARDYRLRAQLLALQFRFAEAIEAYEAMIFTQTRRFRH